MDGERFDGLVKHLATGVSRRRVLGGIVGGALSLVGVTRASAAVSKTTICHKPGTDAEHTITVADSAVPAHLGHGDYIGECCPAETLTCINPADQVATCCPATANPCAETACNADGTCREVPANAGVACGEAADECSPAPVCTGSSTTCPAATSACLPDEICEAGGCVPVSQCPVITLEAPDCFWLDCFSEPGECCWNLNGFAADTQAQCQALDSCAPGGGGGSGGGCYKWATSSDTQIAPPW